MESSTELSAMIRAAMRERKLDRQAMASELGIGDVMVDKLLCGDIVPSRSLEKSLVEKLGLGEARVHRVTAQREKKAKSRLVREEKTRKVA